MRNKNIYYLVLLAFLICYTATHLEMWEHSETVDKHSDCPACGEVNHEEGNSEALCEDCANPSDCHNPNHHHHNHPFHNPSDCQICNGLNFHKIIVDHNKIGFGDSQDVICSMVNLIDRNIHTQAFQYTNFSRGPPSAS